jgi:hypothetical protein
MYLNSNGANREIRYFKPRPGLPVAADTPVFVGRAYGSNYSGLAYVFSSICGAISYQVTGTVNLTQRSIALRGSAPILDSGCNVTGFRDDVLLFSFNNTCGCECGDEPELTAIFPRYSETTNPQEAHSCPYLYAWSTRSATWVPYGKVIRNARGQTHEMTETIKLTELATKFRLAEEEPEHSFIDHVSLRVELNDGSKIILVPTTKSLARRDTTRLHIPAFRSAEFEFKLPTWVEPSDVEGAYLSIRGYYESLSRPLICRSPNFPSGE